MTAQTSDKTMARLMASLLADYGVRDVVMSPGSRNAPLIISLGRHPRLSCLTVVDERSAAFIALGIALQSGRPVALVCTSGSALLNYAPALAEAMYRGVPLIVVTADRPEQWIDRDDSQTIRQPGALAAVVRRSVHVSADLELLPSGRRRASLLIQEALTAALTGRPAPVHINMAFDTPLADVAEVDADEPTDRILTLCPTPLLPTAEARALGRELASPHKVLVVCGFASPDSVMNRAMSRLAALPNVAVLAEPTANIHAAGVINTVGPLFADTPDAEFVPDTVISCGGSPVSAPLKQWLRSLPAEVGHWSVGQADAFLDTYCRLTRRILMPAPLFFRQLASAMQPHRAGSGYADLWRQRCAEYTAPPLSPGMAAFKAVMDEVPSSWNVHFSNGMTIRHALYYDCSRLHRCEANRGVSGIEGSTSTALGAALAYKGAPTLLLTGDMSFGYDLAAPAAPCMTPRLKIVVFDNGGGAIFREVAPTRHLPEVEERFAVPTALNPRAIADAWGLSLHEAATPADIPAAFRSFAREEQRPALLYIKL